MKLKSFEFFAQEFGKEKQSQFNFETRCTTALAERYYEPKRETKSQYRIIIDANPHLESPKVRDLYEVFAVAIPYDLNEFFPLDNRKKKEETLCLLRYGLKIVCKEYGWPVEPFDRACDKVVELDYKNEWVWKKPKYSPDRKHTAEIFCIHEVEAFYIYLIIRESKTKQLAKQELLTKTKPHDIIFRTRLGELKWLSNTRVKLFDQIDEESWTVKL